MPRGECDAQSQVHHTSVADKCGSAVSPHYSAIRSRIEVTAQLLKIDWSLPAALGITPLPHPDGRDDEQAKQQAEQTHQTQANSTSEGGHC
jgi:hypothetical protein